MCRHQWLPALLVFVGTASAQATPPPPEIAGQYRAAGSGMVIAVGACGGGRLCGRIVALGSLPPNDANNPTPALRARRLCGVVVLGGLEWHDGGWRGTLYQPQNGTDYSVSVTPAGNGAIRVTGHSGRPVLSRIMPLRSETWERVASPSAPCGPGAAVTS